MPTNNAKKNNLTKSEARQRALKKQAGIDELVRKNGRWEPKGLNTNGHKPVGSYGLVPGTEKDKFPDARSPIHQDTLSSRAYTAAADRKYYGDNGRVSQRKNAKRGRQDKAV